MSSSSTENRKRKRDMAESNVVPFIESCSDGSYVVHDEAIQYLSTIEGPVGVVTVIGKYRTGKSTLLNRCLLKKQVLTVGSTVNACTKGILLVKETLKGPMQGDQPLPVIILDTEGLGSTDATNMHDMNIFSMALLLSSIFIYNSVGSIDENALSNLSLVANICKMLRVDSMDDDDKDAFETADQLGREAFPPLLWIVRDFALQLTNPKGDAITATEYLEQALRPTLSASDSAHMAEKNDLRRFIKACFRKRHCITMVRPVTDESQLQALSTNFGVAVRKTFQDQCDHVNKFVMLNVRPKCVGSGAAAVPLTGKGLVTYAQALVATINRGAHPVIRDAWSMISESQCKDALESARRYYAEQLKLGLTSDSQVTASGDFFERLSAATVAHFRSMPMQTGQFQQRCLEELHAHMAAERDRHAAIVAHVAQLEFGTKLNDLNEFIGDVLGNRHVMGDAYEEAYMSAWTPVREALSVVFDKQQQQHPLGPIVTRLGRQWGDWLKMMCDALISQQADAVRAAAAAAQSAKMLADATEALQLAQAQTQDQQKLDELAAQYEESAVQLARVQTELSIAQDSLASEKESHSTTLDKLESAEAHIAELQRNIDAARNDSVSALRDVTVEHDDKLREAERIAQSKYAQQLESVRVEVNAQRAREQRETEIEIAKYAEIAETARLSAQQHEAVRQNLQHMVGELRAELSRIQETRLSDHKEWSNKAVALEKALSAATLHKQRLEELYDPALPQQVKVLEQEQLAMKAELQFKAHEIKRLELEVSEARAACTKWQTSYYEEHCKHQVELLLRPVPKRFKPDQ